jgi:predicted transcriptional regulator
MKVYGRDILLLQIIKMNPEINFRQIRRVLKIYPGYLVIGLKKLRENSLIIRMGSKKRFRYCLSFKGYLLLRYKEFQNLYRYYEEMERDYNE